MMLILHGNLFEYKYCMDELKVFESHHISLSHLYFTYICITNYVYVAE